MPNPATEGVHDQPSPRILIASDKFKGSADANAVGRHLAVGIKRILPGAIIDLVAMADGGEGTIDAAVSAGFDEHSMEVAGPLGMPVQARYAMAGRRSVVELAQASGIALVEPNRTSALKSSSYGTGALIRRCIDDGAREIILGLGGSACTDGGAGMMQALGLHVVTKDGREVPPGGEGLTGAVRISTERLDRRLEQVQFILASDVDSPLLGTGGAARVFAPQKGASGFEVEQLEQALTHWRDLVAGLDPAMGQCAALPGAGAAGGVGFAALAFLGAHRQPGADAVMEMLSLAQRVSASDVVITGEGSLDEQSLAGKAPARVAQVAAAAGKNVIAIAGRNSLSWAELEGMGVSSLYTLADLEPDSTLSMRKAPALLTQLGAAIGRDLSAL